MHYQALWPLTKKSNRGFRGGYPAATVAFYGPDDRRASKVATWFSEDGDVRDDVDIISAILTFVDRHCVKTVIVADRIIGCPHEEGTDYPDGQKCRQCPFWATRDRWSGDVLH